MLKMNYWTDKWPLLVEVCPCDVHFNDWVAKQKLKNRNKDRKIDANLDTQFNSGRLLACITSRPG